MIPGVALLHLCIHNDLALTSSGDAWKLMHHLCLDIQEILFVQEDGRKWREWNDQQQRRDRPGKNINYQGYWSSGLWICAVLDTLQYYVSLVSFVLDTLQYYVSM